MKMEGRRKLEREAEDREGVRRVRGKNMKQVERRQEKSEIMKDKEWMERQGDKRGTNLEEDCKRGMQMKERGDGSERGGG